MKLAAGTIATRMVILLSALGVVLLNTHYLGTAGQGTASLLAFGILLVQATSNFVGGGAMVFLVPRMAPGEAFWPAMTWAALSAAMWMALFRFIPIVPDGLAAHACALGFLQSAYISLQQVSLGREQIRASNLAIIVQTVVQSLSLLILYAVFHVRSPMAYVLAMYLSFSLSVLLYFRMNRNWVRSASWRGAWRAGRELFRLGKYAQGGNVLHLLNQRLNIVLLENLHAAGRSATGIFSIALYIAEAIWTVSKSLSIIQYSRISNSESLSGHRRLTAQYLRVSLLVVLASCALLLLVPEKWYAFVFTREAAGLRDALLWLTPGMLANGGSIIYAHFFSGRGLHRENMIASAIGLFASLAIAIWAIPAMGLQGAAMCTSAALLAQACWLALRFHFGPGRGSADGDQSSSKRSRTPGVRSVTKPSANS